MNERAPRFELFDSLRALAAISVLGGHAAFFARYLESSSALAPWAARLDVGVAVFFLISGFLLYRPFVAARVAGEHRPASGAYAWRRVLRIVPGYWLALTVTAVVLGLGGVFTLKGAAIYYGFVQIYAPDYVLGGLPQAWTLCVEISFYAFLPIYAWLMRALPGRDSGARLRGEAAGCLVLFAIAVAWQGWRLSAAADPDHANAVQGLLYLPSFLDHFAIGMGLAVLSVALSQRQALPRWLAWIESRPGLSWCFALVAFWVVSTQIGLDGRGGLAEPTTVAQYFERHYLFALVGVGLLAPAIFGDVSRGGVRWFLGHRWMTYLGLISYGIYLWHYSIFLGLSRLGMFTEGDGHVPVATIWFAIGLVGSVGLASASYYLLERPVLRLRRLVPARRLPPGEPAPATTALTLGDEGSA